jgi:ribonuclease VapC
MIVDPSSLIAILKRESDAPAYVKILDNSQSSKLSAASYFEASIVVDGWKNPILSHRLDELIDRFSIAIEPVTFEQARIARQAYRDYGKGSGHRAGLNFGDCFSYALAKDKREPILFKGDDFQYTDLRAAV